MEENAQEPEAIETDQTPEGQDQVNAEKLSRIVLKAKILKEANGFHKQVYGSTIG
jgi:hypothetical protein